MRTGILKYKWEITGVIIGAIAGWCYWYFVGCTSGTCAITSKPVNSTVYGALMGGLLFSNQWRAMDKRKLL
jgi:phage shock protein E